MSPEAMESKLSQLEDELRKVPGIKNARVVGDGDPTEIHIVASSNRAPKQLVRDVQSLSAAGFGMQIDHRIVSIVRIDDSAPPPAPASTEATGSKPPTPTGPSPAPADASPPADGGRSSTEPAASPISAPAPVVPETEDHDAIASEAQRPVVDRVVLASKGDTGWIKVGLRWPDGEATEGAGTAGMSRESRARGATTALLNALEPMLHEMRAHIDIDQVVIHRLGSQDSVLVRAVFYERGSPTPVVGSALVRDDVATAAVRALLQAVNRKLVTAGL